MSNKKKSNIIKDQELFFDLQAKKKKTQNLIIHLNLPLKKLYLECSG